MTVHGSDARLLERIAEGDPSAVRDVMARYGDLVWSLALRFTGSEAEAEDAVHEIFITLWRKAARFDPSKGAEATFVAIVARRLLIDRWRRDHRRPRPADLEAHAAAAAPSDRPSDPASAGELSAEVAAAFESLDPAQQTLLRLSIAQGCSHGAIAEITGLPLGTVKTRIRTGLLRLRELVREGSRLGPRAGSAAQGVKP